MSTQIIPLPTSAKHLEPNELLQLESFKDFTEEQAAELLNVIEAFCGIAYNIWQRQEIRKQQSATIIPLLPRKKKAA